MSELLARLSFCCYFRASFDASTGDLSRLLVSISLLPSYHSLVLPSLIFSTVMDDLFNFDAFNSLDFSTSTFYSHLHGF